MPGHPNGRPKPCLPCVYRRVVVAGDLNCSRQAIDSAYIQDTPVSGWRAKHLSLLTSSSLALSLIQALAHSLSP